MHNASPCSKQQIPPGFHHTEINNLYQHGIGIPEEKLHAILALPRETVITYLEKILSDAVDRYQYFKGLVYIENEQVLTLHALFLLSELRSENSLPVILKFLENDKEVIDFWLGDHLTSTVWLPVYMLSQNNLGLLKNFMMKPGVGALSKALASDALVQTVLHHPEKTNEVSIIFKEVFAGFSLAGMNGNIIDSEFLGLAVGNAIDAGLSELLPSIKELFDKKYVSLEVNGDYEEVEVFFKGSPTHDRKKNVESIFELYQRISSTWYGYSSNEEDEFDDSFSKPTAPVKIGRNDPCHCGSGKKFKKCCIDKLPS